jgi:hypothetical protein
MANTETTSAPADLKEIGLIFVHEYYTIVNQDPSRLHCFYDKDSVMSHGTEGRDVTPCNGRQASVDITY